MEELIRVYSYECLILIRESQEASLRHTFVVHFFLPRFLVIYLEDGNYASAINMYLHLS